MSTDVQQITVIKSQTLACIAEITAQPKPTYQIDGQSIAWGNYLLQLQRPSIGATRNWPARCV